MNTRTCRYFWIIFGLLMLWVAGATVAVRAAPAPFPTSVPWYNVSRPLNWNDLKGRAVLLDFFTPGCINCVHMLPVEEKLAQRFGKRLVIIGVDAPKFTNSRTTQGLKDFIEQYHIRHPVVMDAHLQLWKAWHAVAWPTFVLVGPDGQPLRRFIGEKTVSELAGPISTALDDAPPVGQLKPLPMRTMAMGGGELDAPGGLAVSKQWVAISDTGHNRIVLANHEGQVKAVIGGCAEGDFERPHGLAFHGGKLYVADTLGQRIRVYDPVTHQLSTLAGSGTRAYVAYGRFRAKKAELNSPWGLAWVQGNLYIGMAGDHQVWRFSPSSGTIGPWAGTGREGLVDGDRHRAQFAQSSGLDAHAGTLYVTDPESSSIRSITLSDGRVGTLIGQGLFKFGLRNGPANTALLQHDEDVVWLNGSLYIADTFNNALRRLNLKTDKVTTITKNLKQPQALAALDANTLLVAESGGDKVVAVQLPSGQTQPWLLQGLKAPDCPVPATASGSGS